MRILFKITFGALGMLLFIGAAVTFTPVASHVYAETMDELQVRLNTLLAQVASLQARAASGFTGQSSTTSPLSDIPSTFRFARTLTLGSHGTDVRYLQTLLNRDAATRVTTPGLETDRFGALTKAAVIRFQNKYAAEVLRPAGLSRGTGTVGALTRNKLNALLTLSFAASSIPAAPVFSPPVSIPAPVASAPPATTGVATPATSVLSWDDVNAQTRSALVNILCTTKRGGSFSPLSGSGSMVDKHGVVLTNAHVAEYFLLKDFLVPDFVQCLIRTGEPARNAYTARLLYISPLWVQANAAKITEESPTGTGENDFAFLLITGSTDPNVPLPPEFSALEMDRSDETIKTSSQVLAASYPAGFLSGIDIQKDLYPASAIVQTGQTYGFNDTTPDLFSIGGSVVAQHGSSGGAIVNNQGKLIGLIVTSTDAAATADRDLRAITMSHIFRSFKKDTGKELDELFASDLAASADNFNRDVAPALTKLLEDAIAAH